MCKIAIFTNTKKLEVDKTIRNIGNVLLNLEGDGFGYAIQGESGVYGERCIDDTFNSRFGYDNTAYINIIKNKYDSFGIKSNPVGALLLHGRTSTNSISLNNTHPMIKQDHYLIHNGVVSNKGALYNKVTNNDTEDLLHYFIKGMSDVELYLSGYYAFGCITPDNKLHVVRDSNATLYITWIDSLDTFLIATTKSLVKTICSSLKVKCATIDEIKDNVHMIFNNNIIEYVKTITPLGYGYSEAQYASQSLGYNINNDYNDYERHFEKNNIIDKDSDFESFISNIDDTYTIYNKNYNEISSTLFFNLSFSEQKLCTIYEPNGIVWSFDNAA